MVAKITASNSEAILAVVIHIRPRIHASVSPAPCVAITKVMRLATNSAHKAGAMDEERIAASSITVVNDGSEEPDKSSTLCEIAQKECTNKLCTISHMTQCIVVETGGNGASSTTTSCEGSPTARPRPRPRARPLLPANCHADACATAASATTATGLALRAGVPLEVATAGRVSRVVTLWMPSVPPPWAALAPRCALPRPGEEEAWTNWMPRCSPPATTRHSSLNSFADIGNFTPKLLAATKNLLHASAFFSSNKQSNCSCAAHTFTLMALASCVVMYSATSLSRGRQSFWQLLKQCGAMSVTKLRRSLPP
mmetsp:Transcript_40423/g.107856  ORF Transcript_40423/g.107856 Transcript_40423/m.107856 type:complete len:311 (-) Transcript_40423:181-1113(-)